MATPASQDRLSLGNYLALALLSNVEQFYFQYIVKYIDLTKAIKLELVVEDRVTQGDKPLQEEKLRSRSSS